MIVIGNRVDFAPSFTEIPSHIYNAGFKNSGTYKMFLARLIERTLTVLQNQKFRKWDNNLNYGDVSLWDWPILLLVCHESTMQATPYRNRVT